MTLNLERNKTLIHINVIMSFWQLCLQNQQQLILVREEMQMMGGGLSTTGGDFAIVQSDFPGALQPHLLTKFIFG
jgi:hypothetical protein